ncbi:hypothetical protein K440DRAFT_645709 [Wilcoxina mikolae CBS 423.85]|nr:hypothetical protein K440DRAFT_645709 [Wilcoxina mikolae CBS 423.85]
MCFYAVASFYNVWNVALRIELAEQMAIDSIGLTIGLVSFFAASLDVLDRVSTAKTYDKDFQLFANKVETERFRLLLWGQAVGLARSQPEGNSVSSQQHELLQDLRIRQKVCELLMSVIQLFEDSEAMKGKRGRIRFLARRQVPPVIAAASNNSRGRAEIQIRSTFTMMKMRWALSGKKKSEELLQNLIYFVDKLHKLVSTLGIYATGICEQPPRALVAANNALSIRRQSRAMHANFRACMMIPLLARQHLCRTEGSD